MQCVLEGNGPFPTNALFYIILVNGVFLVKRHLVANTESAFFVLKQFTANLPFLFVFTKKTKKKDPAPHTNTQPQSTVYILLKTEH